MSPEPEDTPTPAWSTALFSLIHPVKVAAVEAFLWTGEPMSALAVHESLARTWSFGTVAYHVRRLAETGVLVERFVEPRSGAYERFYALAT
jgi:predicted transcriptional regulator